MMATLKNPSYWEGEGFACSSSPPPDICVYYLWWPAQPILHYKGERNTIAGTDNIPDNTLWTTAYCTVMVYKNTRGSFKLHRYCQPLTSSSKICCPCQQYGSLHHHFHCSEGYHTNKNDYDRISSGNKSPSLAKLSSAFPYLFYFPHRAHPPHDLLETISFLF